MHQSGCSAQSLSPAEYEQKKEEVADALIKRVEAFLPGLTEATVFREVGTPRTHRRFLNRCGTAPDCIYACCKLYLQCKESSRVLGTQTELLDSLCHARTAHPQPKSCKEFGDPWAY